jgi:hypothetical protein
LIDSTRQGLLSCLRRNNFENLLGPAIQLNASKYVWIFGSTITNSNLGGYSYAVGEASTKGSIVVADSIDVFGKSNKVSMKYGPVARR